MCKVLAYESELFFVKYKFQWINGFNSSRMHACVCICGPLNIEICEKIIEKMCHPSTVLIQHCYTTSMHDL